MSSCIEAIPASYTDCNVEKASTAKESKRRKQAKKDPTWRTKLKKDPGIPNLFPYKDKILKQIEDGKRQKADDATRRREESKATKISTRASQSTGDATMVEGGDDDALLDIEDGEDEDQDMGDVCSFILWLVQY